jgi:hypothetical protein
MTFKDHSRDSPNFDLGGKSFGRLKREPPSSRPNSEPAEQIDRNSTDEPMGVGRYSESANIGAGLIKPPFQEI